MKERGDATLLLSLKNFIDFKADALKSKVFCIVWRNTARHRQRLRREMGGLILSEVGAFNLDDVSLKGNIGIRLCGD